MSALHIGSLDDAAWDSPWRRRRVGEKVLCSMALVLTALLAPTWPGTILVAIAAIGFICIWARISPRVLAEAMSAPIVFLLIGAVSVLFAVGQSPLDSWWQWGLLSVGETSARQAVSLFAHGFSGTLSLMVLATTTPMVDLLTWGRKLRIPDQLLEVATLTYRLLFVLLDTTRSVFDAQRCRLGDDPAGVGSFKRRWENFAAGLGQVGVLAWTRASKLSDGLAHRGFEDSLATLPITREASAALVSVSLGVVALIWGICQVVA